jgi:hypothetical protein
LVTKSVIVPNWFLQNQPMETKSSITLGQWPLFVR